MIFIIFHIKKCIFWYNPVLRLDTCIFLKTNIASFLALNHEKHQNYILELDTHCKVSVSLGIKFVIIIIKCSLPGRKLSKVLVFLNWLITPPTDKIQEKFRRTFLRFRYQRLHKRNLETERRLVAKDMTFSKTGYLHIRKKKLMNLAWYLT